MKPTKVNILGKTYRIEYVDRPSDVDIYKKTSLWGQIDYWDRSIRVYDNGRNIEDLWHTIVHEIIHGIAESLNIEEIKENEDIVDLLALSLTDVLFRNGWLKVNNSEDTSKQIDLYEGDKL